MDSIKRNTKQKQMVLNLIKERGGDHFTADDLLFTAYERNLRVGKTTVYRILKQLEIDGTVKRYQLTDGAAACYQYTSEPEKCGLHYHIMCEKCGQVIHFESNLMDQIQINLNKDYGIEINQNKTVLYGICKECTEKEHNK